MLLLLNSMNITNPSYKLEKLHKNIDYDSKAEERTVSRHEMPSHVDGFYRPMKHDITHPNDRSFGSARDIFVRSHESIHATYQTTDEFITDCHAAAKTGHYEFIRSPATNAPYLN
jgi:hypothetical protein